VFGLIPRRLSRESNHFALVDGIPFTLPVRSQRMQALMAAFRSIPTRRRRSSPTAACEQRASGRKALLVITVVNYEETVIGKYIEYSVALGLRPPRSNPPPLLPFLLQGHYPVRAIRLRPAGQYRDLRQGREGDLGDAESTSDLDFQVGDKTSRASTTSTVSSPRTGDVGPPRADVPLAVGAGELCQFRGNADEVDGPTSRVAETVGSGAPREVASRSATTRDCSRAEGAGNRIQAVFTIYILKRTAFSTTTRSRGFLASTAAGPAARGRRA